MTCLMSHSWEEAERTSNQELHSPKTQALSPQLLCDISRVWVESSSKLSPPDDGEAASFMKEMMDRHGFALTGKNPYQTKRNVEERESSSIPCRKVSACDIPEHWHFPALLGFISNGHRDIHYLPSLGWTDSEDTRGS